MSVCVECGHMQLYYVPNCNDPAVGQSQVLIYAGPELEAVEADEALFKARLEAMIAAQEAEDLEQTALEQDTIAQLLDGYVPPTSDATPGKHLVQAFKINTKEWVYVRSDKLQPSWAKYTITSTLLEPTMEGNKRQLARQALASAWDEVLGDIKDDISAGIPAKTTGTLIKGEIAASLSDKWNNHFTAWVDAVNGSLTASHSNANFDISAAAQIFRFYAGFVGQVGYDPSTGTYRAELSGNARAVLAEAKADLNAYLPNRDGWHALLEWGDPATMSNGGTTTSSATQLDFGYFRFKAALGVDAMAGASVMGTVGVEYAPLPDGQVRGEGAAFNGKGEVAVGAFAGVEASAEVKGALEWDNPEKRASSGSLGWAPIYEVGVQIAANAGIGAEAQFKIGISPGTGKLYVTCGAQLVVGVGAKGSLAAAVGLNTIGDFIMYIYHQLVANDFSVLRFISEAAWEAIKTIAFYLIIKPVTATIGAIGSVIEDARAAVLANFADAQEAEDMARRVKARPELLTYAPPEAKGMLLYKLSETWTFASREEHQEGAVLVVMDSIQTRREWDQVIERVTPTGIKSTRRAGMRRLNGLMDWGSQTTFTNMVNELDNRRYLAPDTPTRLYRTQFA